MNNTGRWYNTGEELNGKKVLMGFLVEIFDGSGTTYWSGSPEEANFLSTVNKKEIRNICYNCTNDTIFTKVKHTIRLALNEEDELLPPLTDGLIFKIYQETIQNINKVLLDTN